MKRRDLVLVMIGWLLTATIVASGAERPRVGVEVDIAKLPRPLRERRVEMTQVIHWLEDEASRRLENEFPIFQWLAAHAAQPGSPVAASLRLQLVRDGRASARVVMTGEFQSANPMTPLLKLDPQEVFSDTDLYPDASDSAGFVTELKQRAGGAWERLADRSQHERWREFIRTVPLAHELVRPDEATRLLVMPLKAKEIRVGQESVLQAEFVTQLGETPMNGTLDLAPRGAALGAGHVGWQECEVLKFSFQGATTDMWVDQIAAVIAKKKTLVVRAYRYVRSDTPILSLEEESAP